MRAYDPSRSNQEQQRRVRQAMVNKGAVKQVMIRESEVANKEPSTVSDTFIEFRTPEEQARVTSATEAYFTAAGHQATFANIVRHSSSARGYDRNITDYPMYK